MSTVEAAGFRFAYDSAGEGDRAVVLQHASAGNRACWRHQQQAFADRGFRAIGYDRRGYGDSRGEAEADGSVASDLIALADALALDRFALVAHAASGFHAFDAALASPERVSALVISCSQGITNQARYADLVAGVHTRPPASVPRIERELGATFRAEDPAGVAAWEHMVGLNEPHVQRRQQARREVSFEDLASISVPTLFVAGEEDVLAPPAVMRLMADRIHGSRFAVIPRAGHSAYWERPAEWNQAVLSFLDEVA